MDENKNDMREQENISNQTNEGYSNAQQDMNNQQSGYSNAQQDMNNQQSGYSNAQQDMYNQQSGYGNAQQNMYNQQNVVYDDQWVSPGDQALAIAGLILGILSLVCCCTGMGFPFAVGSLIVSIISLIQKKPGSGMAIAGIVCSVLGLLLAIILIIASLVGAFALEGSAYTTFY